MRLIHILGKGNPHDKEVHVLEQVHTREKNHHDLSFDLCQVIADSCKRFGMHDISAKWFLLN